MKKMISAMAVAAMFALPTSALALDSGFDAMAKSGSHQFYVWCTGARQINLCQCRNMHVHANITIRMCALIDIHIHSV